MIHILFLLKQSISNCLAKFKFGARDIWEFPLLAASWEMETAPMASYGWQNLATQPWAPTRKGEKQAPVTLIKQWKEREGQGRESASEKSLYAQERLLNANPLQRPLVQERVESRRMRILKHPWPGR